MYRLWRARWKIQVYRVGGILSDPGLRRHGTSTDGVSGLWSHRKYDDDGVVPYVEMGQRQRILTMDCRGCKPVVFLYNSILHTVTGKGKKGTSCTAELYDEWYGIDDELNCEMRITDFWFDIAEL